MVKTILNVDPFNPKHVELWFSILESRFVTAEVTDDITKFHCVMGSLTADMLTDHIELNPYELLKKELIRVYSIKRRSDGNDVESNQIPGEARTSSSPIVPATSNQTRPCLNRPVSPETTICPVQPPQPMKMKRKRVGFADQQTPTKTRINFRVDLTGSEASPNSIRSSAVESHVEPTRRVSGAPPVPAVSAGRLASKMMPNRGGTLASRTNGTLTTSGQWLPASVLPNNHFNQSSDLTQPSTSSNIAQPSISSNIAQPSISSNIPQPSTSSNIAQPSTSFNFTQPPTSMLKSDALSQALEILRRNGISHMVNSQSTNGRT